MIRKAVTADAAPPAIGPYSQAIVANGFVFCSGTVGVDPATGSPGDGIEKQTVLALRNLAGRDGERPQRGAAKAAWTPALLTPTTLTSSRSRSDPDTGSTNGAVPSGAKTGGGVTSANAPRGSSAV